jgi:hypothetical protein
MAQPVRVGGGSVRVIRVTRQLVTPVSVLFWIGTEQKHVEVTSGSATVSLRPIVQHGEPRPAATSVLLPANPFWNCIAEPQRYGVYVWMWRHGDSEELEVEAT